MGFKRSRVRIPPARYFKERAVYKPPTKNPRRFVNRRSLELPLPAVAKAQSVNTRKPMAMLAESIKVANPLK